MDMQPPALLEDHGHPGAPPAGATPTALACVLEYAPGAQIALPIHAGVELVEQPRVVPVPGMPYFCLGLLAWQGRQLPLIDFQVYLQEPGAALATRACSHVLVVAYQTAYGQPIEYGALCAPFLIRMIEVADNQQCPLPAGQPRWTGIAISCLMNQGQAVPVVDLARVFGRSVSSGTN
jgi:chemotaxis signal transduction protein